MTTSTGLRELHKQQTQQLISDAASSLFAERGFDGVTVAEVARAAGVSEMTVFNHFPTKEDLFFAKMEFFEERLLDAVRGRATGVSALEAFRRPVVDGCRKLGENANAERIARAASLIGASPPLQVREREIVARFTDLLAALLAIETGKPPDDVEPRAVADALMGVHRAVVHHVRSSVLAGRRGRALANSARSQARRAFARLEGGIAEFAIKTDRGGTRV